MNRPPLNLFAAIALALVGPCSFADDDSTFDAVLKATLRDARVDYRAIRENHLARLTAYLDALAKVDPAKLKKEDALAHYINLYNATMIRAVGRPHSGHRSVDARRS